MAKHWSGREVAETQGLHEGRGDGDLRLQQTITIMSLSLAWSTAKS